MGFLALYNQQVVIFFSAILKSGFIFIQGSERLMYIYGIALVLLLVIAFAGYSFLNHSIEKRRIRKQRIVTALRARRNVFRDLVTGFPLGFLSKDLMALLYRSIIDCCDQLTRIEPEDSSHQDQLAHYTTQLNELNNQEPSAKVRLENPQQIREARQLLQELLKFVIQQATQKLLNPVQAEAYEDQIKRLMMQIAVDGHIFNAKQSQTVGKLRLAIHHYGLARKAMVSENSSHSFDKQIVQLDALIKKLEEKAASVTSDTEQKADTQKQLPNKEWDKIKPVEKKEDWKIKNLYE
jgi:hypothetical protein